MSARPSAEDFGHGIADGLLRITRAMALDMRDMADGKYTGGPDSHCGRLIDGEADDAR